jgi:hypothetical protein
LTRLRRGLAAVSGARLCRGTHHRNARHHRVAARLGHHDEKLGRGPPFRRLVLGPRKLRDVRAGVFERDQLATAGQRDRFVEMT